MKATCQQTYLFSRSHKAWQAACRTCYWIGPLRNGPEEARADMIHHPHLDHHGRSRCKVCEATMPPSDHADVCEACAKRLAAL